MAKFSEDILRKTTEILRSNAEEKQAEKNQLERERRELVASIGSEVAEMLTPTLERIVQVNQISAESIRSIIREIKIEAPVMPEIKLPPINVPRPNVTVKAPTVNVPRQPDIHIPETKFPERMTVDMDVDNFKPLPVMMMDTKGRPLSMGTGGGGKADFFTIKDIRDSSNASIITAEGALKVTGDLTVTGSASSTYATLVNADGTLYDSDNPLPITGSLSTTPGATFYASDAIASTNLIQVNGSTLTGMFIPVEQVSGAAWSTEVTATVGLTDTELRASSIPVSQVSGAIWSTSLATAISTDTDTIGTTQVSGAIFSTNVVSSIPARPIQVRGSLSTAYATLVDSSEDTLIAASSGNYLDLIEVMCANTSDAAQTVHLRDASGGSIVSSIVIPAESTAGIANTVPLPQSNIGNAWTVQNAGSDLSNTTIYVTAKFSQET